MDRAAWRDTIHRTAKSQTLLKCLSMQQRTVYSPALLSVSLHQNVSFGWTEQGLSCSQLFPCTWLGT